MKVATNDTLFYTAIVAVFALLLFLLVTLGSLWNRIDDSRDLAHENITWTAANTEIDLLKFTNALQLFAIAPTPKGLEEARKRYELLFSRIDLLTQGELGRRLNLVENGPAVAKEIRALIIEIEDDVYTLNIAEPQMAIRIATHVDTVAPQLYQVLVDVSNATSSRIALIREAFEELLGTAIICLTLMTLISAAVAVMLINERKRRHVSDMERDAALAEEARASKAKSEFLSSMSHELRTPLNAILGFGQLLNNNKKNPLSRSQQKAVNRILESGEHLLQLINQVLDLSKIEAGQDELHIEKIALDPIILDTLALLTPMATRHGISLELAENSVTAEIFADRLRMKQIVMNLVSNAIKYNRDHGHVTVSVHGRPDDIIEIVVADTGMGIPDDYKAELFKPFSRLGNDLTEIEGTGIGLAISRSLLLKMSGDIAVRSTKDVGSEFIVSLPGTVEQTSRAEHVTAHNERRAAPQPFKVLYVEDNPTNIVLMEDVIDVVPNARLISAHNAELGIEIAEAEIPDVVLMDINLPGMNGLEALAEFRRRPNLSEIPVIAITGDPAAREMGDNPDTGFHAFIIKPFDLDHLMSVLQNLRPGDPTAVIH